MISMNKLHLLHIFAVSRVAIVLLAIMIEIGVFSEWPEVQNWLIIVNPVILAVTNGYVQTQCVCYAANMVSKTNASEGHSQALGNLIGIAITMGLAVGGLL